MTRSTGQGDISQPLIECAFQQHSTLPSATVFQQEAIILYHFSFRNKGQMSYVIDYPYDNHAGMGMFRGRLIWYFYFQCYKNIIVFTNRDSRFYCIL